MTKSPPKPSISSLARKHQVCRETIRKIRDSGVAIDDELAVARALSVSRARLESPAPSAPPADGSESYSEARRRKASASADSEEIRVRRMKGELIETAIPRQVIKQLDHAVGIIWKQTPNELAGVLDGLSGAKMRNEIIKFIDHTLIPRFAQQLSAGIAEIDASFEQLRKILPPQNP